MADIKKGLPVRTEEDSDKKVQVKIHDYADPDGSDKQLEVSEKLAHVRVFGEDPANAKKQLKLSESGNVALDGDYDASNNSNPSSAAPILHDRVAAPDKTDQNFRPTGVQGTVDNTVHAADVSLHDQNGNPYTISNPLPVFPAESPGDEIEDYQTTAAVADGVTTNHDYTVTALKTFLGCSVLIAASSRVKFEIKMETAAASGVFNTKYVGFTTEDNPTYQLDLCKIAKQVAGAKVRIAITNRDNQAQDVYSTLLGIES